MSSESEEFKVGDSVLIVGTNHDGELGTIIAIAAGSDGQRYLIVFENGNRGAFNAENTNLVRYLLDHGARIDLKDASVLFYRNRSTPHTAFGFGKGRALPS